MGDKMKAEESAGHVSCMWKKTFVGRVLVGK
jgi:hypothetical protein